MLKGGKGMASNLDTKQMLWAGLLMVVGIILQVVFHSMGVASVILPMHIPILLSGFILSWPFAISVAFLTPLLSAILTGMPPLANLLYMVPELVTYAIVISIMFKENDKAPFIKRIYLPLLIAMIIGRIIASFFQAVLFANSQGLIAFFASSIVNGFPGIVLQLIIIPLILYGLIKGKFIEGSIR